MQNQLLPAAHRTGHTLLSQVPHVLEAMPHARRLGLTRLLVSAPTVLAACFPAAAIAQQKVHTVSPLASGLFVVVHANVHTAMSFQCLLSLLDLVSGAGS